MLGSKPAPLRIPAHTTKPSETQPSETQPSETQTSDTGPGPGIIAS